MKSTARVVVNGGVVGCSIHYHLAKNGWTDYSAVETVGCCLTYSTIVRSVRVPHAPIKLIGI